MRCPKCSSTYYVKHGTYTVKRKKKPIQKFLCKDCGKDFICKNKVDYGRRITKKQIHQIFKLNKDHMITAKRKSCKGSHNHLNIAKMVGVSEDTVSRILRQFKETSYGLKRIK